MRNHCCFLFLGVLRCFSSPGSLRTPMHSVYGTGPSRPAGCPIRISTAQCSLTAPRGISVFAPSFVGSWHLGILRAPFLTSPVAPDVTLRMTLSLPPQLAHVLIRTLTSPRQSFLVLLASRSSLRYLYISSEHQTRAIAGLNGSHCEPDPTEDAVTLFKSMLPAKTA